MEHTKRTKIPINVWNKVLSLDFLSSLLKDELKENSKSFVREDNYIDVPISTFICISNHLSLANNSSFTNVSKELKKEISLLAAELIISSKTY